MATDDHHHMIEAIAYTVARDIANLEDANEKIDTLAELIATNAKTIERLTLRVEILSNQMRVMYPAREALLEEDTQLSPLLVEISNSPKPVATPSFSPYISRPLFLAWILATTFLLWYGVSLYRSSGLRASLFVNTCPIPSYGPVPNPLCLA